MKNLVDLWADLRRKKKKAAASKIIVLKGIARGFCKTGSVRSERYLRKKT